jgi:hypothetical protein
MNQNNRFISAARGMGLGADAAGLAADNAEMREEKRGLFIERGLMSPSDRAAADRAARKAQRLSNRFERTNPAAVQAAKAAGKAEGHVLGKAGVLNDIEKNTAAGMAAS